MMNKQQKEYTVSRITSITKGKEFECECEKPDLLKHIRRAIVSDLAKLKSAKDITKIFEDRIIEKGDSYRCMEASADLLFQEPESYKQAMFELALEKQKHSDANIKIKEYAQRLIDAINLGKYEDGAIPIKLMESYVPEPPTKNKTTK
jgi:hypothetical protein